MGASYDDVAADYMVTYYNYYGITPDDPRYEKIKVSYLDNILATAFGVSDIKSANLRQAAETYLKNIGLTDAEKSALKNNCVLEKSFLQNRNVNSPKSEKTRFSFCAILPTLSNNVKSGLRRR